MGHKVDISEVIEFSDELKTASEDIKSSLRKVEENIEQINAMESFSGKAAKEAKGYFNDLHKTILESFNGLFTDLDNNLKKHLDEFGSSVDSSDSAIILNDYLKDTEEDVSDDYEELSENQDTINETIDNVADISSATAPSFSKVTSNAEEAVKVITDLEEKLDSFTSTGDTSQTKDLLHQIEVTMKNAKTNDGTARFTDYKGDSKNVGLAKLKDYNQGKMEERNEKAKLLANELMDGKTLNYEEREILYHYIQEELLNEEDNKHMDKVSSNIGNEKFEKYINEEVLSSEASLEKEISRLERYLFAGNKRPDELRGDTDDRVKLRSYLDLLKNHHIAINEVREELDWDRSKNDPLLARVEYVNFEYRGGSEFTAYGHMESEITIDYHQDTGGDKGTSREDFLEAPLQAGRVNRSEIDYYYGQDAVSDRLDKEELDGKKELDNMTGEFIGSEFLGMAVSSAGRMATGFTGFLQFGEHLAEKGEKSETVQMKRLEKVANKFELEMQINDRDVPGSTENRESQLYPTDETFEQIDRWKAIHEEKPDFPYNEDLIEKRDWTGMYKLFRDGDDEEIELSEENQQLYNYMLDRTPSDNKIVKKLMDDDE